MISLPVLESKISFDPHWSKWWGAHKNRKIRIALCMVNHNDSLVSIPLSSISAYLKKYNSDIEIRMFHIISSLPDEKYNPEGFARYLKNWEPDLFAMSMMSCHWDESLPYLSKIKEVMPQLIVLIGGYQPILNSDITINYPAVDFICDGDGEIPTSDLVKYLQGKIDGPVNGLWEKLKDGTIFKTPRYNHEDLSTLPFPDYTLYEVNGKPVTNDLLVDGSNRSFLPVMTGRGCVYNCTYCSNSTLRQMWPGDKKKFLRKYDVELLVDELVRLKELYDIKFFSFWDELFFSNIPYVIELFELYKAKVKVPFSVVSRIEVMDYEMCKIAAEAGCESIYFGLESGNEEYRRKYLKRFEKNIEIMQAAENCRKVGIKRITFNIIGMPYESKGDMIDTLELNKKIDPEFFFFFIYLPLKGTKLYDIAKTGGLLYDRIRTNNYYDGLYSDVAIMNIKQTSGSASEEEFNEVRKEMIAFQKSRVNLHI